MFLQQCPHCAHVNPTGSRFCNACGGPLDLAPCPHCGAINAAIDVTCRDCGARLALPGERESATPRERPAPPPPERPPAGGHIEHAMRRDTTPFAAASGGPSASPPRASPGPARAPPQGGRASHRAPHAAVLVIAASVIALALLAIGYAWSVRSSLEREGTAPTPQAPAAATSPAPPSDPPEQAARLAPVAPAPQTAPSPPAADACPPAVAAMGLCRTYDALAPRN